MLYRDHHIDVVGTTTYISGPQIPWMTQVPKREGSNNIEDAKAQIDEALEVSE